MTRRSLERALPSGQRLLLDTSALIAYLGQPQIATPVAKYLVDDFVRPGRNPAIVSMITAMELLIGPLEIGVGDEYRHTIDFLLHFPNLSPFAVDIHVAHEAAMLRAQHHFRAQDALIIGSGLVAQVGYLVTNDKAWRNKLGSSTDRIRVCYLEEHLPLS